MYKGKAPTTHFYVVGAKGEFGDVIVALKGARARYVRLQLGEKNYLHLDEVEVYGQAPLAKR